MVAEGGSNSVSTVDISVGYVGLKSYNPLLVGVQMLLKIYLGPINVIMGR